VLTVAVSDNNAEPLVARLRILEDGPVNMKGAAFGEPGFGSRVVFGWSCAVNMCYRPQQLRSP
jgi:hypothetical protein